MEFYCHFPSWKHINIDTHTGIVYVMVEVEAEMTFQYGGEVNQVGFIHLFF